MEVQQQVNTESIDWTGAEAFKKAQDLYSKNRGALDDIVLSGRDINKLVEHSPPKSIET